MSRTVPLSVVRAGLALAVAVCLGLAVTACLGAPSPPSASPLPPSPPPTPSVAPSRAPSIAPSPPPSAAPLPSGDVLVDVPEAGIRLAVPSGWEVLDGDDLADAATRADIVVRYPGMDALLEAAAQMGDRATPALVAVDPAAGGTAGAPGPSVSVLVAQPTVSGPLLDFVAGFVADGFTEAFGASGPDRSRLETPMGEAVRLRFDMEAADGAPVVATAYVVGAAEGTLLITVMGPPGMAATSDPDALILGSVPLE